MIRLGLKHNYPEAEKSLRGVARQVPFAAHRAINDTLFATRGEVIAQMFSVFRTVSRYTQGGVLVVRSPNKRDLSAQIGLGRAVTGSGSVRAIEVEEGAGRYLRPHVHGGPREHTRFEGALRAAGVLPAGQFAVPARGARITRGVHQKVLAQLQAFRDPGQRESETTRGRRRKRVRRGRGVTYFLGGLRTGRAAVEEAIREGRTTIGRTPLPLGIYERRETGFGGAIRGVFMFVSQPVYPVRLPFAAIVEREYDARFEERFYLRLFEALRTAR